MEVQGEREGRGSRTGPGAPEVRDKVKRWDKGSSRALQQLGQIVWRPAPHPEVSGGSWGAEGGARGHGGGAGGPRPGDRELAAFLGESGREAGKLKGQVGAGCSRAPGWNPQRSGLWPARQLPRRALDPRSVPSMDWKGTGRPSRTRINIRERARTPGPCLGAHLPIQPKRLSTRHAPAQPPSRAKAEVATAARAA